MMGEHSFLIPFAPRRPEEILPYVALAQWSSVCRLWQGQSLGNEAHAEFAYAAASGFRVPVGIGVTLMPMRHPYLAALQAQQLAMATGHSVLAGYGPGAVALQQAFLGSAYRSQLGAAREYVTIMRGLLEGSPVEYNGEHFTCHAELPQGPRPEVAIGLGVLRPAMATLAGEVADAAITWLTPASYLRDVIVPAVHAGARTAGRAAPRVVAIVPVALADTSRDPAKLALSSNGIHLQLPHYQDMLRRSGIDLHEDDPLGNAAALVKGDAYVYGDLDEVVAKVREFYAAGVDEVVLNLTAVRLHHGGPTVLAELEQLLGALP